MEVFVAARADTDVVWLRRCSVRFHTKLMALAEKVLSSSSESVRFHMKSMAHFLDFESECLRPLALAAPNPKMACIWETSGLRIQLPLSLAEWDS